jgi:hypothetical protein
MSLRSGVDTSRALDTAERTGVTSDPIIRKLSKTLPGSGKYDGSKKNAPDVLVYTMHIAECLAEVSPAYIAAWNGQMRCTASGDQGDQEHKAMVETAHQLHERLSQNGAPALTMMENMSIKMLPINFQVTKEAAAFATEAHIHHMCTVANLIKTCCFEALAYDLVSGRGRTQNQRNSTQDEEKETEAAGAGLLNVRHLTTFFVSLGLGDHLWASAHDVRHMAA